MNYMIIYNYITHHNKSVQYLYIIKENCKTCVIIIARGKHLTFPASTNFRYTRVDLACQFDLWFRETSLFFFRHLPAQSVYA